MTVRDADILLDMMVRSLGPAYHVWERRRPAGDLVWRIDAFDPPHRYIVEHPDYG